jgi:hypothetical protein
MLGLCDAFITGTGAFLPGEPQNGAVVRECSGGTILHLGRMPRIPPASGKSACKACLTPRGWCLSMRPASTPTWCGFNAGGFQVLRFTDWYLQTQHGKAIFAEAVAE